MNSYKDQLQEDFLYHHGVKGMKWGVRKDKYESMSRYDKQLTKYKHKMMEKLDTHYRKDSYYDKRITKKQNKLSKAKEKGNQKKIAKLNNKIKDEKERKYLNSGFKKAEQTFVKKMKYDDMQYEKAKVNKNRVYALGYTLTATALGANVVFYPNANEVRTNNRIDYQKANKIRSEAHKKAKQK